MIPSGFSDSLWKADHRRYDSEGLPRKKRGKNKRGNTIDTFHNACIYSQWLLFITSRAFEEKTCKDYLTQEPIKNREWSPWRLSFVACLRTLPKDSAPTWEPRLTQRYTPLGPAGLTSHQPTSGDGHKPPVQRQADVCFRGSWANHNFWKTVLTRGANHNPFQHYDLHVFVFLRFFHVSGCKRSKS